MYRPKTTIKCSQCMKIIEGYQEKDFFLVPSDTLSFYWCKQCYDERDHADAKRRYELMIEEINELKQQYKEKSQISMHQLHIVGEEFAQLKADYKKTANFCYDWQKWWATLKKEIPTIPYSIGGQKIVERMEALEHE